MTNLNEMDYAVLQELAKGFGVPANMKKETLITVLSAMMFQQQAQTAPQAVQETAPVAQPAPQADPFAQVLPAKDAVYTPTTKGYVSPKLLKFAMDLYKRFNMDVMELDGKDYAFIQAKVNELTARPLPASEKQLEIIKRTVGELQELGVEITITDEILDGLTGGAQGTASQVVDMLFRKRTEAQAHGPLSDKQAETLTKWFFCPDIPWENFEVQQKVAMPIEKDPNAWRFMTPEEFTAELKAKITKSNASKFIDDHGHLYFEWQKTRITQYQIDTIRQLEERMMNMHSIGVREFAVVDGVVQETYRPVKRDYAPQGYVPMTEAEIRQLDTNTASKLITQMQAESKRREKSAVNVDDTAQQDFEDKRNSYGKNQLHAMNLEHQSLIDVIFKIESAIGQENEDLHESINELMIQRKGDSIEVGQTIKEFMLDAMETKLLTFSTLVSITQNSAVASQIVEMIDPAKYDLVQHGGQGFTQQGVPAPKTNQNVQSFIDSLK